MAAAACSISSFLNTADATSFPASHAVASSWTSSPSQSPSRSTRSTSPCSMGEQQQDGRAQGEVEEPTDAVTSIPTPSQLLQGSSNLPELPLDPEMHEALNDVTSWRSNTSQELTDLPHRTCDASSDTIAFNRGLWTWLTSMAGSKPAGSLLRRFTAEEQQALVEGHDVMTKRMGLLQDFLNRLSSVVGERSAQLQQAGAALADILNDNAILMGSIETSKDTSQKHINKLIQAAANLRASHVKLEKLERAVAKLSSEVAAGVTMARKLEREKAGLKLARLDACEAYSVQKEELQAARTKLQVRYTHALHLQEDMDHLKPLCTKQQRDLQAAAKQLLKVQQKHQDKVSCIDQRAAAEQQQLVKAGRRLWERNQSVRQELGEVKAWLVQKKAEVEAADLELAELQEVIKADTTARKALTATNQDTQRYLKQQQKARWQLRDEALAAGQAEVKAGRKLDCAKMQRHELGHQVHLKLKELAALLEDKRPLMDKCHELTKSNLFLKSKIIAAGKDKALADHNHSGVRAEMTSCNQRINQWRRDTQQYIGDIRIHKIRIQLHEDKAPEYDRAKATYKSKGQVHNKLIGARDRTRVQLNALQAHAAKARKARDARKEGEKKLIERAIEQTALQQQLAEQQQAILAEQRAMEKAQSERQEKIAAAQALQATLLAQSNLKDNPRKKELLDEATKVEGKVGDANKKVGQRVRSWDAALQELEAARKKIADAEEAAGKADAAIQSKANELQQQRSCTQRAYADKALNEKNRQELGSHINRLQGEAVSRQSVLRQIRYENRQLARRLNELMQTARAFDLVVVVAAGAGVGAGAGAAVGAGAGAAAGAGVGAGVAAFAGVVARGVQGSTAAEPLPAVAWPSLADASTPPRGGR